MIGRGPEQSASKDLELSLITHIELQVQRRKANMKVVLGQEAVEEISEFALSYCLTKGGPSNGGVQPCLGDDAAIANQAASCFSGHIS